MQNVSRLSTLWLLLAVGLNALAATTGKGSKGGGFSTDSLTLDEVVVTATRIPKSLKDVPVATRVISSGDIKKSDASNIQDLLTQELPGLEFGYAMSQETSLTLNGFGGNAVLFLVDGERLAGETMNNVDYNRLNLENVERVEIVKGASSALYGANAVGGVVNIITRNSRDPWRLTLSERYSSECNEWRSGGELSCNSGKWNSSTTAQFSTRETVKLTDVFDTESNLHYVFGGSSLNLKERLVYMPVSGLCLTARGGYFERISNRATYDDRYRDYSGGLRGEWTLDDTQNIELSYGYDQYDKSRYIGGSRTHDHDYSNRQHILHGMYTKFFGQNGLIAGADFMHDYLSTYQFKDNASHSQTTLNAFVQFDFNPVDWLNILASVRDDWFSESENNALTARLAAMFKIKPVTIRASYAGGFRAPTLKEMYMDFDMAGIQMIYGNPELKPEKSHNLALSLERNGTIRHSFLQGSYSATVSGYYNIYDNRITTAETGAEISGEPGAMYINEQGVKVGGIDGNIRYTSIYGVGISASYNFLHINGKIIDSQFSQPRPHSATWRLDYDRQIYRHYGIYAALSGRYLSNPISEHPTDGAYSIWKFTLIQRIWQGISLNFAIDNLLNYRPKIYYWNSPATTGINFSIGLSLDINKFV